MSNNAKETTPVPRRLPRTRIAFAERQKRALEMSRELGAMHLSRVETVADLAALLSMHVSGNSAVRNVERLHAKYYGEPDSGEADGDTGA